jgi:hypothetical protein
MQITRMIEFDGDRVKGFGKGGPECAGMRAVERLAPGRHAQPPSVGQRLEAGETVTPV